MSTKANSNIFSHFNSRIQQIFTSGEANEKFPIGCSEDWDWFLLLLSFVLFYPIQFKE